jgi:hypothetical protein
MGIQDVALFAFNRGRVSRLALARTDVKRVALSADTMTNWMARVLGSMMLRPGLAYLGTIPSAPRFIPFVFSITDTALLEFTASAMRVWVADALISRTAVGSAVTNGTFDTDLTGWTDADDAGGVSAWVTGGYMGLTGDGTNAAIREQAVTVAAADQAKEHGLRIVIQRGPVTARIGTTSGGDDLLAETDLGTGTHSLAITPNAATMYIRFQSRLKRQVLVDSCSFEAAGVVSIPAPFAAADLGKIRYDESADVVYLSCYGYQQRKVERRSTRSWSLVRYQVNNGPLRAPNVGPITITPSALSGNITLTASKALFKSTLAPSTNSDGAIFRVTSSGQSVSQTISAQNTFTGVITVEGVGAGQRTFTIVVSSVSGTGSTVTLQRSLVSDSGPWTDVTNYAVDTTTTLNDGLDNQVAYYRIGVKTGNYVAGTITAQLTYAVGSIKGYVRITAFTSSTIVSAEVLSDLGGTSATDDWAEGEWSDRRGWPSAVALAEGRLWWSGKQGHWGSVSDDFENHDEATEGDSGPINRDVGSGPLDNINWLLPVSRLILGAEGAELSCKSSSLDEPLTPTNFQIKADSTQGSAAVGAVKIDSKGVFVQNGATRVFELDKQANGVDYDARDLTVLIPEICQAGVSRMAVQRKPDTRIHCVLSDGTAAIAIYDRAESVECWLNAETRSGDSIVDAVILPGALGTGEDAVYYATSRVISGATVYFLEKWALESECVGGTLNKQADAFITYSGIATDVITGLTHLVGATVVVWADGKCLRDANGDVATFVVDGSGQITLTNAGAAYTTTNAVVGLAYRARWKSTKLAYAAQDGTALNQRKKLDHLGVILDRTHHKGLKYGPDFDNLSALPAIEDGAEVAADTVHSHYDKDQFEFDGQWGTDSRLCLQAEAPRNCNLLAATLPIEERSKR